MGLHRRCKASTRERGQGAEDWAALLLQRHGWTVLARNWWCRWGELDLVLAKPRRLLLVEVKARRRSGRDGGGVAAFGVIKRRRLARAWACWLAAHPHLGDRPVEVVLALVPLPVGLDAVRWLRIEAGLG
ncbi:YraN family protein [Synechococcus sp. CCY9201]|uniref:YraN family protein n=1 Tax=unclassified Synechococcus TaxID=2626047 RepID=UPI0018CD15E0|nr:MULTISPECIES: YraN family protein [unclassified Synechococcus]MEA5423014.1 YraN family protein [Synechococcus sp. CCY9202]MEA5473106.1 YraN family protein [Synechococcus sp. CCY9201]QPN66129.1 YraN family protein [Synechococcus sp. CBW1006]